MSQLTLGSWWLVRPVGYDGVPGEGYLVQGFDAEDAVRELDMGPAESVEQEDDG